jgi:proteasome assembly chaperone 3
MTSTVDKFPVVNKQAAKTIQGLHTEVLVSGFADKIFIVVTQYGRIGSLVSTIALFIRSNFTS